MSEPQEKIDISDLKETFLECPVCVEHFNQTDKRPRLLQSCLHAFCTQCLHQLLLKEGKGQITCPLCRQVQIVKGNADSLPLDPVRNKLVDYVQIKHQIKILCTDCPNGNEAEGRCEECDVHLCKDCTIVHKRHSFSRDHDIIFSDEEYQEPPIDDQSGHFCPIHPRHDLEFYCITDEQVCCKICTISGHRGHGIAKVEDVAEQKKKEIDVSLKEVSEAKRQVRQSQKETQESEMAIQQIQKQSISEINRMFNDLKGQLDQRRNKLVTQVEDRSKSMLSSVQRTLSEKDQTLAIIESFDTYFTEVKDHADPVEMLQMYPDIKQNLMAFCPPTVKQDKNVNITKLKFFPSQRSAFETLLKDLGTLDDDATAIPLGSICVEPIYLEAMKRLFGYKKIEEFCRIEDSGSSSKEIQFIARPGYESEAKDLLQRAQSLIQEEISAASYSRMDRFMAVHVCMFPSREVYVNSQEDRDSLMIFALDESKIAMAKEKLQKELDKWKRDHFRF